MTWSLSWGSAGPTVERHATCESCGGPFACELSLAGCWCGKVDLTSAARAQLRAKFQNCLCPTCLKGYAGPGPSAAHTDS
jgi:hypothetical protein